MALAVQEDELPPLATPRPNSPMEGIEAKLQGRTLTLDWNRRAPGRVVLTDAQGRELSRARAQPGEISSLELPAAFSGVFWLRADGQGAQVFCVP